MTTLDELKVIIDVDARRMDASLKEIKRGIRGINTESVRANKGMSRMFTGSILKGGASLAIGFKVAEVLGDIARQAVAAGLQLQLVETTFSSLFSDKNVGASVFRELERFSIGSIFTAQEVLKSARQLKAFNIEAQDIIPTIKALGNIATVVGRDSLPRLTTALGQVRTKGKLDAQDTRQFTEAAVPIIEALAISLGKTTEEIIQLRAKGLISFKDVKNALMSLSTEAGQFAGVLEDAADTPIGKWKQLTGVIEIGAKNVITAITPMLNLLGDAAISAAKFTFGIGDADTRAVDRSISDLQNNIDKLTKKRIEFEKFDADTSEIDKDLASLTEKMQELVGLKGQFENLDMPGGILRGFDNKGFEQEFINARVKVTEIKEELEKLQNLSPAGRIRENFLNTDKVDVRIDKLKQSLKQQQGVLDEFFAGLTKQGKEFTESEISAFILAIDGELASIEDTLAGRNFPTTAKILQLLDKEELKQTRSILVDFRNEIERVPGINEEVKTSEQLKREEFEKTRNELKLQQEAYQKWIDDMDIAARSAKATWRDLGIVLTDSMVMSIKTIEEQFTEGIVNMRDDLSSFADFFDNIWKDLERKFVAKHISQPLTQSILQITGDLFGGPGGQPSGALASGGPVYSGSSYLVGERGPELFSPNTSGKIHSNPQTQSMMGQSVVVNQSFNISSGAEMNLIDQKIQQSSHAISVQAQQGVFAALNKGGSASRLVGRG